MLVPNFDRIVLNHRIGEQLLTHFFDITPGFFWVGTLQVDFNVFPLTDIIDPCKAQGAQGMLYGFSLGIENAVFKCYVDFCLHDFGSLVIA